jgi:cation-transporting ATPase 13A2
VPLCVSLAYYRNKLSRSRPLTRVMSPPLMISTVLQCVVIVVFQLLSLKLLQSQPTYVRFRGGPELHDTVVSGHCSKVVAGCGSV